MGDAPPPPADVSQFNLTYINDTIAELNGELDKYQGHSAWILVSTALVFIMIPGLGYFYSGMARSKNALSLIMLSVLSLAVVSVQWWAIGFSLTFGKSESKFTEI